MDGEINYAKIEEHPAEADRLFKIFMRLEFALKEIGYCRATYNQAAEVDWERFANQRLGSAFFDLIKRAGSANTLIYSPPKRQSIDNAGNFGWEAVGQVSNIQELIGSIRRVRNNLFHGGKSGDPDGNRSDMLIEESLSVLHTVLRYDEDLRMMFEGNY